MSIPKFKPAKASEFIHWCKDYRQEHPDAVAILYVRVSNTRQVYEENILNHLKALRNVCRRRNIQVVAEFTENISGRKINLKRTEFIKAIELARKLMRQGKDVFILTTTTDRYLRNEHYYKTNWKVLPTRAEYESFLELADGVPLVTYKRPDLGPRKSRSFATRIGQHFKNNRGGRPKGSKDKKPRKKKTNPKRQRLDKLPNVFAMREKGASWGLIKEVTGVKKGTAQNWIRKGYKHWKKSDGL